jgi:hypothetical protein
MISNQLKFNSNQEAILSKDQIIERIIKMEVLMQLILVKMFHCREKTQMWLEWTLKIKIITIMIIIIMRKMKVRKIWHQLLCNKYSKLNLIRNIPQNWISIIKIIITILISNLSLIIKIRDQEVVHISQVWSYTIKFNKTKIKIKL